MRTLFNYLFSENRIKPGHFISAMIKPLLLIFLVSTSIIIQAQSFEWIKPYPIEYTYNPDMLNYSVSVDHNDHILWGGMFMFHETYGISAFGDLFLQKYDDAGNILFTFFAYGPANIISMMHDNGNNLILIVDIRDDLLLDSGDTVFHTGNSVSSHLLKLSPDFDLIWSKNIAANFSYSSSKGLAIGFDDKIYFGTDDFIGSRIGILYPDGDEFTEIIQNNVAVISSIAVDNQGNIYSAGSCASSGASFGGTIFETSFSYNTYIAKYNSEHEAQWVNYVEDVTCPTPQVIVSDSDHIYFVGELFANTLFGNLPVNGPNWVFDYFVAKLSGNGEFEWVNEIPESTPITGDGSIGRLKNCAVDSENNIYVGGFIRGSLDWGNGITTGSTNIGYDLLVVKYDTEGEVMMAKQGGGESYDKAISLAISNDDDLYIAGYGQGSVQYDTLNAMYEGFFPLLIKLNTEDNTTGFQNFLQSGPACIFPNPASGVVMINLDGINNGLCIIRLHNLNGSVLEEFKQNDKMKAKIDLSPYQSGVYFLSIQTSGHRIQWQKVLKI